MEIKDLLNELEFWLSEMDYIAITEGCHIINVPSHKFDHWVVSVHLFGSDAGRMSREFTINLYKNESFFIHYHSSHNSFEQDKILPFESFYNFYHGETEIKRFKSLLVMIEDKFGICIQDKWA